MKQYFEPYVFAGSSVNEFNCYVCGSEGHIMTRSLTKTQDESEKIELMFKTLGLHAKLVDNATHQDVQLGACDGHKANLEKLDKHHKVTKEIDLASIVKSLV